MTSMRKGKGKGKGKGRAKAGRSSRAISKSRRRQCKTNVTAVQKVHPSSPRARAGVTESSVDDDGAEEYRPPVAGDDVDEEDEEEEYINFEDDGGISEEPLDPTLTTPTSISRDTSNRGGVRRNPKRACRAAAVPFATAEGGEEKVLSDQNEENPTPVKKAQKCTGSQAPNKSPVKEASQVTKAKGEKSKNARKPASSPAKKDNKRNKQMIVDSGILLPLPVGSGPPANLNDSLASTSVFGSAYKPMLAIVKAKTFEETKIQSSPGRAKRRPPFSAPSLSRFSSPRSTLRRFHDHPKLQAEVDNFLSQIWSDPVPYEGRLLELMRDDDLIQEGIALVILNQRREDKTTTQEGDGFESDLAIEIARKRLRVLLKRMHEEAHGDEDEDENENENEDEHEDGFENPDWYEEAAAAVPWSTAAKPTLYSSSPTNGVVEEAADTCERAAPFPEPLDPTVLFRAVTRLLFDLTREQIELILCNPSSDQDVRDELDAILKEGADPEAVRRLSAAVDEAMARVAQGKWGEEPSMDNPLGPSSPLYTPLQYDEQSAAYAATCYGGSQDEGNSHAPMDDEEVHKEMYTNPLARQQVKLARRASKKQKAQSNSQQKVDKPSANDILLNAIKEAEWQINHYVRKIQEAVDRLARMESVLKVEHPPGGEESKYSVINNTEP